VLPTYTSSQNNGCPIDTWQVTLENTSVISVTGLNPPSIIAANRVIEPTDRTQHASFTFYVKASASNGGSSAFFGPYTLHIGCTQTLINF